MESILIDRKPHWLLIAIASRSKNPGSLLGKGWPEYATDDEAIIDEWMRQWPGCNFGLLLGPSSGVIDIEYDSDEGKNIIEPLCAGIKTPTYKSKKSVHRLFAWSNEFQNQKAVFSLHGVEWRFGHDRAQSVMPPSVHESGTVYEWIIPPSECEVAEVPEPLLDLLHGMQKSSGNRHINTVIPSDLPAYPENSLVNTARELARSLSWSEILTRNHWTFIRKDNDKEYWWRPGKTSGSISATLNHEGNDKLTVFSANAHPLQVDRCYDKFAFLCAMEHGDDSVSCAKHLESIQPVIAFEPDDDDDLELESIPDDPGPFPVDCLYPPGLIESVAEYTLATSDEPQPLLALAGAISLMSAITGRKIRNERNNRTNLFVLGLGPSGCGKERPRNVNTEILSLAGGSQYIGAMAIGSGHGVESQLREWPIKLFMLDEIGDLLKAIKKERSSGHMEIIIQKLKMLMTSSHTIYSNSAVSDSKMFFTIDQPHCVIFGTATAEKFWSNLSLDAVEDGFLGRILPFEVAGYAHTSHPVLHPVPDAIIEQVKAWINFMPSDGNLAIQAPKPVIYKQTPQAFSRHQKYCDSIDSRIPKDGKHRPTDGLWKRARGRAASLALLFAASRQGPNKDAVIDIQDVELAIKFSNWITRKTIFKIATQASENQWESDCQRVFNIIKQREIGLTALISKTRWLRSRDRKEIIETLIGSGKIELTEVTTKTKKRLFYKARKA